MLKYTYLARRARSHRATISLIVGFTLLYAVFYHKEHVLFPIQPEFVEKSAHPVEILHQEAIKDFQNLLSRQSKTVDEAIEEYKDRYERSPPPGFDKWVKYALRQESPIIDDFDTILENLEPFYRLDPREVRQLMNDSASGNNEDISLCSLTQNEGVQNCGYFGDIIDWILDDVKRRLPDMIFPVNTLDEPSVLLTGDQGEEVALDWPNLAHQHIMDRVAVACMVRGRTSTNKLLTNRIETYGLPFVQSIDEERDLCLHPDYEDLHGFLSTPSNFRQAGTPVPLLSRAAPYPFADILMPSPQYALPENLYDETLDRPWHQKKNAVFWHGSTTGGYWHKDVSWQTGHRQRFVTLTTMPTDRGFTYLEQNDNNIPVAHQHQHHDAYRKYTSPEIDHTLYDVHLSSTIQCDQDQCDEQAHFFHIDPDAKKKKKEKKKEEEDPPPDRAYGYRFAFDIDGNSYSGRFHRHLAAHTTPLKMSIFREWHDERLVPWLHYAPVSQGMGELPELVRFLAATDEGRRVAFRIAEEGRRWYYRALTPAHQGLYVYRLLLELAWLQDPARTVEE